MAKYERVTFHLRGKRKSIYLKDTIENEKYLMGTEVAKTGEYVSCEGCSQHKYFLEWPLIEYRVPQFLNPKYQELEACGHSQYENIQININEFTEGVSHGLRG